MKFKVRKKPKAPSYYPKDEITIARKFASKIYKEFGPFIKAVVLFGSVVKKSPFKKDIDILVIVDDVSIDFTEEIATTYRIITEKIISEIDPKRLHIQSMKFTSFWEYARAGDPVAVNILRNGLSLIDTGFFDPLQALLDQGRIRPSKESIYTYFTMAPGALHKSKQHILTAMVDLYWAAIDACHAALMKAEEIPPSPEHVANLVDIKLVRKKELSKETSKTMRDLYTTFKKITHREVKEISGKDYDTYKKKTEKLIQEVKKYIEKK